MTTKNASNKPVRKIRIGQVSATIWDQNGFYTASLERAYKDRDGKWQSSSTFSVQDLIVVGKVASLAADAILALGADAEPNDALSDAA